MQTLILAVNKPTLAYARTGVAFYEERLRPLGKVEVRYLREGSADEVAEAKWREWQMRAVKRVAFLIGPADGHTEKLRAKCDMTLSLGRHTMQHELALVALLEQVYRIHTLLAGSPYHRD